MDRATAERLIRQAAIDPAAFPHPAWPKMLETGRSIRLAQTHPELRIGNQTKREPPHEMDFALRRRFLDLQLKAMTEPGSGKLDPLRAMTELVLLREDLISYAMALPEVSQARLIWEPTIRLCDLTFGERPPNPATLPLPSWPILEVQAFFLRSGHPTNPWWRESLLELWRRQAC